MLEQLLEAVKGEYRLDLAADKAKLPQARLCRRERLDAWLDEQIRGARIRRPRTGILRLLGRFGAANEGIFDVAPESALPDGILFVGPSDTMPDSLTHPATVPISTAWDQHQTKITDGVVLTLNEDR